MKPLALLTLLLALGPTSAQQHPADFDRVSWQTAAMEDMALFEPYIGDFRGKTWAVNNRSFYFTVRYQWYDRRQRTVKYTLHQHFTDTSEARMLGEGFYFFEPLSGRIAVTGLFVDGRAGQGFITPFNPEDHSREVRIRGTLPDGTVNEVRDTFWVIDKDTWGNRTFIAGPDGQWRKVSEDLYRRIET